MASLEAWGLKNSVKRIVFHEITESAIIMPWKIQGMSTSNWLSTAGRRILDRAVGYKLSHCFGKKNLNPGLSAGRVQSVSVYILVEGKERSGICSRRILEIKAEFTDFSADLKKIGGKPAKVGNEKEAFNRIKCQQGTLL
ncbi:MAG: hypothetical protein CM1200mP30_29090 [Pseudomonadota bacterium]|nr:MAG: hypothetical protein CM1200mP30_29090 [Pseudomonadota bacterium]